VDTFPGSERTRNNGRGVSVPPVPWIYNGTSSSNELSSVSELTSCGGGVEYLHRSPASASRRRR
jgi:hypothetical protein